MSNHYEPSALRPRIVTSKNLQTERLATGDRMLAGPLGQLSPVIWTPRLSVRWALSSMYLLIDQSCPCITMSTVCSGHGCTCEILRKYEVKCLLLKKDTVTTMNNFTLWVSLSSISRQLRKDGASSKWTEILHKGHWLRWWYDIERKRVQQPTSD